MYVRGKMRPVRSTPGMRGGRVKKNDGGVNSTMIYLYIIRTFIKATMYPHPAQQKKRKNRCTYPVYIFFLLALLLVSPFIAYPDP
jgi:hypothetical protein